MKRTPAEAILSMLGVLISPPKQERSEKPRSSATMTRKLGRLGVAIFVVCLVSKELVCLRLLQCNCDASLPMRLSNRKER